MDEYEMKEGDDMKERGMEEGSIRDGGDEMMYGMCVKKMDDMMCYSDADCGDGYMCKMDMEYEGEMKEGDMKEGDMMYGMCVMKEEDMMCYSDADCKEGYECKMDYEYEMK